MLLNIKTYLHKPQVMELLSYAVFPDDQHIKQTIASYEGNEAWQIQGFEDEELLVGLVGYEKNDQGVLTIHHIAVIPENRGKGYGRGMLLELIKQQQPNEIVAETDEEAVDFYRNVGFMIYSLGEVYPGVERFRCVYEVEEAEE